MDGSEDRFSLHHKSCVSVHAYGVITLRPSAQLQKYYPHRHRVLACQSWPSAQVDTKPASDIIAGAVARAASQGTIHPLDTLKVRMQAQGGLKGPLSKIGKLLPPAGALSDQQLRCVRPCAKEPSVFMYAQCCGSQ